MKSLVKTLAVVIAVAVLVCALDGMLEAYHDCTGEGCAVCAVMQLCRLILSAAAVVSAAGFFAVLIPFGMRRRRFTAEVFFCRSLFSQRVLFLR